MIGKSGEKQWQDHIDTFTVDVRNPGAYLLGGESLIVLPNDDGELLLRT